MKVYKIWCEWDMGFQDLYSTREKAQDVINRTDWESLVGESLKTVEKSKLVIVEELKVI